MQGSGAGGAQGVGRLISATGARQGREVMDQAWGITVGGEAEIIRGGALGWRGRDQARGGGHAWGGDAETSQGGAGGGEPGISPGGGSAGAREVGVGCGGCTGRGEVEFSHGGVLWGRGVGIKHRGLLGVCEGQDRLLGGHAEAGKAEIVCVCGGDHAGFGEVEIGHGGLCWRLGGRDQP